MSSVLWLGIFIIAIAVVLGFRARSSGSESEFWINEGRTGLFALVATIVTTQIGAGTILGIAASTFKSGTGFGLVALISTISGFTVLAYMASRIRQLSEAQGIVTLPEFIGLRFGRIAEVAAAIVTALAYIGLIAGQIVALAAFLQVIGLNPGINTVWVAGIGAISYCAFSGLRGDIAADQWFFVVMVVSLGLSFGVIFAVWPPNLLQYLDTQIISPVTFGGYTYLVAGIFLGAIVPVASMELWIRIFASHNPVVAKRALIISAAVVVPFYCLPLLIGLLAAGSEFRPRVLDGLFLEFLTKHSTPAVAAVIGASLTAVILSTANTYALVLSGVVSRNLFPFRTSLTLQRILVLGIGMLATTVAFFTGDIVSLILGSFYVVLALFPAIMAAYFGWRVNAVVLAIGMVLGAVAAIVTYPIIGPQSFIPALLVAGMITGLGRFLGR